MDAAGQGETSAHGSRSTIVNISIELTRRLLQAELSAKVREITRDFDAETAAVIENAPGLIDSRRIRGIPMQAKGVSGVQTDSFVPGSDEHLDEMDAA
jgi:hypothetical protein